VRATRRQWAAALGALALLNFGLTFESVWPTPWIRPHAALSVELAAAVLALAFAAARIGPLPRRWLAGLAAGFTVLALGRYVEVTARELYGRPINLYYDGPHVPRVLAMFVEAAPLWLSAAVVAGVAIGIAALYALARWAWTRVGTVFAVPGARRTVALAAAGVCAAYPLAGNWFTPPVSASYVRQGVLLAQALSGTGPALGASPDFAGGLQAVRGADVFIVFLESYGAATYDRPALAHRIAPDRAALVAAAAASGRAIASAFVESPTFGGASWLAHASLLSGVDVRDGDAYNLLTTQRRDTLVHAFARAGYRTIALMPGLRQDWREGVALYGFDAVYDAGRLDYRGPAFGWWRIPDQYALAKLDRVEVAAPARQPLFVFFPTINSHAPFKPVPPYQPDWARLASDVPYDAAVAGALETERAEWTDLDPAYAGAVGYVLASLAGYLRKRPAQDLVLVVLGDHQPPAGVAGERPS
jgi:phosphoglycerol transferase MdoB-like AlkP superfamily enzyme